MAHNPESLNFTRECPICGKKFIPGSEHVYRDKTDPYKHFVCSYPCIPTPKIIKAIGRQPLFGHRSGKKMNTNWLCFMKEDA